MAIAALLTCLQLVDYVRKFKGMESPQKISEPKTIKIGECGQWENVKPAYHHYKGNTMHRNHRGYYDKHYSNKTGRNDILGAKVARDQENIYFYVETAEDLSPETDRNWMLLFIDIDRDKSTGWNGYDYIVNRITPKRKAVVEKNVCGHWKWEPVGESTFFAKDNVLEIKIPRSMLNLSGKTIDMEFKWNDNMQDVGNIMDFYINGDSAPGGRFNFVYSEKQKRFEID